MGTCLRSHLLLTLIITPIGSMLRRTTDTESRAQLNEVSKNAGDLLQLVNQLLDFTQVERLANLAGKGHRQLTVGNGTALCAFQAFELAFHHQHLQVTAGKVLLRQIGTAGNAAFFDVVVGNDPEQFVELRHAQALARVGFEQACAVVGRQAVSALEFDVFDREATCVGRRRRGLGPGFFTG